MAGFHEIIGHEQLIAHLQSAIVMDKVSHAYIINGPKDSGKMMLAQAFAMALQCETSIRNREGATGRPEEKLSPEILAEPCLECRTSVSRLIMILRSNLTAVSIKYTLWMKQRK